MSMSAYRFTQEPQILENSCVVSLLKRIDKSLIYSASDIAYNILLDRSVSLTVMVSHDRVLSDQGLQSIQKELNQQRDTEKPLMDAIALKVYEDLVENVRRGICRLAFEEHKENIKIP